ncbi:hypothetical protein EOD39_12830 [Acipenser ruthenus]|uniref:Uncharacterized protein n=1 Tax=Acipenser ruthenus TaxID=7906 RepID=A0A662YQ89_ACIRT|nr:hypothetical protein EOD39_12830 [Acipenser ruthenus]
MISQARPLRSTGEQSLASGAPFSPSSTFLRALHRAYPVHRLQPLELVVAQALTQGKKAVKALKAGKGHFRPEKPDGSGFRVPGQAASYCPCFCPSSASGTSLGTNPAFTGGRSVSPRAG